MWSSYCGGLLGWGELEWSFQKGRISKVEWGEESWDWVGVMGLDWCVLDDGVKLWT